MKPQTPGAPSGSGYMMESAEEAARLLAQEKATGSRALMLASGLTVGMRALDAGCGPGLTTLTIAELVGASGSVVGVDLSDARLEEGRRSAEARPNVRFEKADISRLPQADDSFDYAWSQYVLEYLPKPEAALAELIRVTRPGGRVVVSEIDSLGLLNWPTTPELEEGISKFVSAARSRGFDIYIGRKLFNLFHQAGLQDIRVQLRPFYICAGAADPRLYEDWETRFKTLEPVAAPAFGGGPGYWAFCNQYLAFLKDPASLKMTLNLVTDGRVP